MKCLECDEPITERPVWVEIVEEGYGDIYPHHFKCSPWWMQIDTDTRLSYLPDLIEPATEKTEEGV